jgi:uncharacterized membrane protein YagU involved in acid resistance
MKVCFTINFFLKITNHTQFYFQKKALHLVGILTLFRLSHLHEVVRNFILQTLFNQLKLWLSCTLSH